MSIRLTPAAVERVSAFMKSKPDAVGFRFGVKKTGCSGYAYVVDLTDTISDTDHVFEQEGLKLVVDAKSLPLVDGTQIDFARKGINAAFAFENPNVTGGCGCGESFTISEA